MKKILMATAVAATALLGACDNVSPKASIENDVDSLSYEIGLAYSEQAKMIMLRSQVDSAYLDEYLKGIKEGVLAEDDKKKMAYYMGLMLGMQSNMQMLQSIEDAAFGNDSTRKLSRKNFLAGLGAAMKNKSDFKVNGKVISPEEAYQLVDEHVQKLRKASMEKEYADTKKKNEEFMAKNAKAEGVKTLQDGVQYKVIKEGTGAIPADTSSVKVIYEGRTIDGNVFDSSEHMPDKVANFPLKNLIKGFSVALTHMPVGSEWEIYIPWNMAYGELGSRGIPPFSALIFKVTLVDINK